jgi:hypothetical protein
VSGSRRERLVLAVSSPPRHHAESLVVTELDHLSVVPLGIIDERVCVGDHIVYFWHTDLEFERGCDFLIAGLRDHDHCVVFGHDGANRRVCDVLERRGLNVRDLRRHKRLHVLEAATTTDATLKKLASTFRDALDRGAPLIRVLGNMAWGEPSSPRDEGLLMFEAKVTTAARSFPSVIVCMYDADAPFGSSILHDALKTHPVMAHGNVLRVNSSYVQLEHVFAHPNEPNGEHRMAIGRQSETRDETGD